VRTFTDADEQTYADSKSLVRKDLGLEAFAIGEQRDMKIQPALERVVEAARPKWARPTANRALTTRRRTWS